MKSTKRMVSLMLAGLMLVAAMGSAVAQDASATTETTATATASASASPTASATATATADATANTDPSSPPEDGEGETADTPPLTPETEGTDAEGAAAEDVPEAAAADAPAARMMAAPFAAPQSIAPTTAKAAPFATSTYTLATVLIDGNSFSLNLFSSASTDSSVVNSYRNGTSVKVYSRGSEWSEVGVGNQYGYMQTRHLTFGDFDPDPGNNPNGFSYAYVLPDTSAGMVTLYNDPDKSSSVIANYYLDKQVKVYSRDGVFSHVEVDGYFGYIYTRNLSTKKSGALTDASYATVVLPTNVTSATLHESASDISRTLSSHGAGTTVRVLRAGTDWCNVEIAGKTGYMRARFLSVQSTRLPENSYAYVRMPISGDRLSLYLQADTGSRVLSTYASGTRVKLIQQSGGWSLVSVDNYQGYMQSAFLDSTSTGNTGGTQGAQYAVIKTSNPASKLNLRAQANLSSQSLGSFANGTSVYITSYGADWSRVEVGGKTGYMKTQYLSLSGSSSGGASSWTGNNTSGGTNNNASVVPSGYAVVNNQNKGHSLNLRQNATTSSKSLGMYSHGTRVRILEYGATWCRVEVSGRSGYMVTSNLLIGKS